MEAFKLADCQTIAKTFERRANYCTTEESVFAMMTPLLVGMRTNCNATVKMWNTVLSDNDSGSLLDNNQTEDKPSEDILTALEPTDKPVEKNLETGEVINQPSVTKTIHNAAWARQKSIEKLKECIPCELGIRKILHYDFRKAITDELKKAWLYNLNYYKTMLAQLADLLNFWDYSKNAFDLCAMWKFFSESVCLPDFRRIITILMALLMKMAFELNSFFDMLMMFVAPLILPFLLAIIAPLEQFLLLIVKPIDCIINAIASQIDKLDYSAIFNMQVPDISISVGPGSRQKTIPPVKNLTAAESLERDKPWTSISLNTSTMFNPELRNTEKELREAQDELETLRSKGQQLDLKDAQIQYKYVQELKAARAKLQEKQARREKSAIGESADKVRKFAAQIKDAFARLIHWLEMAKKAAMDFVTNILDEVKKMLSEFLSGGNQMIIKLFDKMQIIRLISTIVAIIDFIKDKRPACNNKEDVGLVPFPNNSQSGLQIYTDPEGITHIVEDENKLSTAIDKVVGAGMKDPSEKGSTLIDGTRQRVKSLIKLTGDPVLDDTIARTVDIATSPMRVTFRCPLQTSVADTEKVNQWIQELG